MGRRERIRRIRRNRLLAEAGRRRPAGIIGKEFPIKGVVEDEQLDTLRVRGIKYTPFAKQFVKKHPKIIKAFLDEIEKINKGEASTKRTVGNTTFRVEKLPKDGFNNRATYRITIGGRAFFVKEVDAKQIYVIPKVDFALEQMKLLRKATRILAGMKGVRVAKYHLAWQSGTKSFLVTDFYNGYPVQRVLTRLALEDGSTYKNQLGKPVTVLLTNRIFQIKKALSPYFSDVKKRNMMYLPQVDTIVIFDLRPWNW